MDDVDMKRDDSVKNVRDEQNGSVRERERDRERRDRSRSRDRRDRDRSRDKERDRRESFRRRNDHWEPEGRVKRRSRSRSPRRRRSTSRRRSRRFSSRSRSRSRDRKNDQFARSLGGPLNADPEEAAEMTKNSKRENRVYVGNLSYDVRYRDLMEFMRGAGEVLFAEVLVAPSGVSKGCGLVEFASHEDAQRAIRELSEQPLLGRPVFIREDRETEARFGAGGAGSGGSGPGTQGNQLYIGNLPYQAGWQDIKDLFRNAGSIVRADINTSFDGRPKGSGTVLFENVKDAQNAIDMYNNYQWYGRTLEVREDRYAGLSGPGGRGSSRGGFRGGLRGSRGGGLRGSFRGGGMDGEGRSFGSDIYADYNGPSDGAVGSAHGSGFRGPASGPQAGRVGSFAGGEPNQQIMVRNLPWSTTNEDLVELFETTGIVELAEILFDGTRSKGSGVVQFSQTAEAETAIAKFQSYMYGGRPLDVSFNDRWHTFTPGAARGAPAGAPMQADGAYY